MPQDHAIHKAANKGETPVIEELLNENAALVNARGASNRTPLHKAVGKNFQEVVRLLIERGADISLVDANGLLPLHWAALYNYVDIAALVVGPQNEMVNKQTNSGETALHLAAEKGFVEFIQFLLDRGADPLITDNNGTQTPYDLAKKGNHKAAAALLRPKGQSACCVML